MATTLSAPARTALSGLGDLIAGVDTAAFRADAQVDAQIRSAIACVGFGALTETEEVPSFLRSTLRRGAPADAREAMAKAEALTILGAASDLDPLDRGPAHLALPSTVAALVLAQLRGLRSADVVDAVAVGIESGARLRRCVTTVRPGIGFHSVGTFGLFAAAATCARLLRLDAAAAANAVAISLTRAAGLAVNSAMTRIGLTHFGRAAGSGIEAALLAEDGWVGSQRLDIAFATFFGTDGDLSPLGGAEYVSATRPAAFKHYPCNIYVNLAIRALLRLGLTAGPIEVVLPPVRHLDNARPRDLRELRNSVQGAVAAVSLHGASYKAFAGSTLRLGDDPALDERLGSIGVRIDPDRSTSLDGARVDVTTASGTESSSAAELGPWQADDVARLRSGFERETRSWGEALLEGDPLNTFDAVLRSMDREKTV
jgi:2-methylcitrate dehydratase PrpD